MPDFELDSICPRCIKLRAENAAQAEQIKEAKAAFTVLLAEDTYKAEQIKRLEADLEREKSSYRSLAAHHNEHCVCMAIY